MGKIVFLILIFPTICLSQSREVSKIEKQKIGEFYDEINKAPFSLTKNEMNYDLCFFNKGTTNSESQITCLPFNEPESAILDFFNFGLSLFDSSEMSLVKNWATSQYNISVSKEGNFIILRIWDNYFKRLAVTTWISKENWNKLFGKY